MKLQRLLNKGCTITIFLCLENATLSCVTYEYEYEYEY